MLHELPSPASVSFGLMSPPVSSPMFVKKSRGILQHAPQTPKPKSSLSKQLFVCCFVPPSISLNSGTLAQWLRYFHLFTIEVPCLGAIQVSDADLHRVKICFCCKGPDRAAAFRCSGLASRVYRAYGLGMRIRVQRKVFGIGLRVPEMGVRYIR